MWQKLSEPALDRLKTDMFVELETDKARQILDNRKLGFAQVRLLPKEQGIRPIMNLRKRGLKAVSHIRVTLYVREFDTPMPRITGKEKRRWHWRQALIHS